MNYTTSLAHPAAGHCRSTYAHALAVVHGGFIRGLQAAPAPSSDDPMMGLADFVRSLDPPRILVTRAEYARSRAARGLPVRTKSAVYRAVCSGRISAFGGDKLLDPRMADFELSRLAHPTATARASPTTGDGGGKGAEGAADVAPTAVQRRREGPMDWLGEFIAGAPSQRALDWMQAGSKTYSLAEGAVPMELCLRLPSSSKALRRVQRDMWIAVALRAMPGSGPKPQSAALCARLALFVSRGEWSRWKDRRDPPAGADPLLAVMFSIMKNSRRHEVLSVRHMLRIAQRFAG